ncbi:MAG: ubiquitin-like domain-containing protein [Candidatus Saccharibacteria bacterium]
MKRLNPRLSMPVGAMLAVVFVFIVLIIVTVASQAGATNAARAPKGHLLTIHDRGQQTVVLSQAGTVGDALKEAGVKVDKSDNIEPAASEKLVASEYQVNIYRARPVIVVDGMTRQKIITPYQTANQIAASAGVTLYSEDTTTLSHTENITSEGAGLLLTIDRATSFAFTLYGKTTTARTQGQTVGDMLKGKNITLTRDDRVLPDKSTKLTEGMTVRVWREGKQTITVDEEVAFDVEKIQDGDQPIGYRAVKSAGVNGSRSATYEVVIQDGQEVSRTLIASITTKEPTKQIEAIGVKSPIMTYNGGGSKSEWMMAAGIPQSEWGYVDSIVGRESGWNPNSLNRSSGACGLAQALPCGKVPGNPMNPVDSLRWQYGYVTGRYGGYAGAYGFWQANHWY